MDQTSDFMATSRETMSVATLAACQGALLLAEGEPRCVVPLRLRIETREEVVERFGKRRVCKDGIAQIVVAQFAHHR
jgi:hypothetical protein